MKALEEYYRRGYRLLLNGDVEELQKFRLNSIRKRWAGLYTIFDRFASRDRLIRLIGNHDLELLNTSAADHPVHKAVRWQTGDQDNPDNILIYHGHQASRRYELYNQHVGWVLRNIVGRLPVRNFSISHDDTKKMLLEERIYRFSGARRILSIIGHTHRPLFESLSKTDLVKFNIERLCRQYASAEPPDKRRIRGEIEELKEYLARTVPDRRNDVGSIYHDSFVVPCVFNSGCVLGKRGITCLELTENTISLKYWFDRNRSRRYLRYEGYESVQLPGTDYYETVIQSERLDYIFSRVHLLGERREIDASPSRAKVSLRSSFQAGRDDTLHEVLLREEENQHRRQHGQYRHGHDLVPADRGGHIQGLTQRECKRKLDHPVDIDQDIKKIVPGPDELKYSSREDRRFGEGQYYPR